METWMWIVVAAAVVMVLAGLALWWMQDQRRRRSRRLEGQFGPEYNRLVHERGRHEAETELEERQQRVEQLDIHPLAPEQGRAFANTWEGVQRRFVDDPGGAVSDADRLVTEVMLVRGYPMGDFEQRAADISVDHPDVVANYRAARRIADEHSLGRATTEDLRQAMVHYRALFRDLLAEEAVASR